MNVKFICFGRLGFCLGFLGFFLVDCVFEDSFYVFYKFYFFKFK